MCNVFVLFCLLNFLCIFLQLSSGIMIMIFAYQHHTKWKPSCLSTKSTDRYKNIQVHKKTGKERELNHLPLSWSSPPIQQHHMLCCWIYMVLFLCLVCICVCGWVVVKGMKKTWKISFFTYFFLNRKNAELHG